MLGKAFRRRPLQNMNCESKSCVLLRLQYVGIVRAKADRGNEKAETFSD